MSETVQESDDEGSQNEYIPRVGGEIDLDISVDSESPFVVILVGEQRRSAGVAIRLRHGMERISSTSD